MTLFVLLSSLGKIERPCDYGLPVNDFMMDC